MNALRLNPDLGLIFKAKSRKQFLASSNRLTCREHEQRRSIFNSTAFLSPYAQSWYASTSVHAFFARTVNPKSSYALAMASNTMPFAFALTRIALDLILSSSNAMICSFSGVSTFSSSSFSSSIVSPLMSSSFTFEEDFTPRKIFLRFAQSSINSCASRPLTTSMTCKMSSSSVSSEPSFIS